MITNKTAGLYYLCAGPKAWHIDIVISEKKAGHFFGFMNKSPIVWPNKLSSKNFNPTNFHTIKSSVKRRDIVIIDRIKGETPKVNIGGHVNRSG